MRCLLLITLLLLLGPAIFAVHKGEIHRADIERTLGKPIQVEGAELVTYRLEEAYVKVEFTRGNIVRRLTIISLCPWHEALREKLDRLVSPNTRGQFKQERAGEPHSCVSTHEAEYKNVVITYSRQNCMNCNRQEIKVEWPHIIRSTDRPANKRLQRTRLSAAVIEK